MSEPIKYTPRAVRLIRNGASAAELGWSAAMFDSVCVKHRIDRPKPLLKAAPQIAPASPRAADIAFNEKSGEVIRAGIIVALPPAQASAFQVLWKRYVDGVEGVISSAAISDAGTYISTARNVAFALTRLNQTLAPLRLSIEGKLGSGGGYRLRVDA